LRAEETASVSTTQSSTTLLRLALGDKIQGKSLSEPFRVPASNFKAATRIKERHQSPFLVDARDACKLWNAEQSRPVSWRDDLGGPLRDVVEE
jgi:hypothetical protein